MFGVKDKIEKGRALKRRRKISATMICVVNTVWIVSEIYSKLGNNGPGIDPSLTLRTVRSAKYVCLGPSSLSDQLMPTKSRVLDAIDDSVSLVSPRQLS